VFSIKTKQVVAVTLIVGVAVGLMSAWYLSSLAGIWLGETGARANLLGKLLVQRAFDVSLAGGDPATSLATDAGMRSLLQGSLYDPNVVYASIVDTNGRIIAHSNPDNVGRQAPAVDSLPALLESRTLAQVKAIYTRGGKSFEVQQPLLLGASQFGSVRIGVSTLLVRTSVEHEMYLPLLTSLVAILVTLVTAMFLAQVVVRPIHVISSGLARLGRGELDVKVDLPEDAELTGLEDSFKAVTARLAAHQTEMADQRATLQAVVENLEDAVALFSPDGGVLFANAAMRAAMGSAETMSDLPREHPYRIALEATLSGGEVLPPANITLPDGGERLLVAHPVADAGGALVGVLLFARNLTYLSQVESTLSYSRKLTALGRLSAGIAHEVKNPLNATMIHLELLKMQLAGTPEALEHVAVIAAQVRRLDEVVQGFLKFTRPEELRLQPVAIEPLIEEIMPIVSAEASAHHIDVRTEFPANLPPASADASLLRQAFLNLALNACQAMPNGGRLRIAGSLTAQRRIQIAFEDTGVGMPPEHLDHIFDLYFTTRQGGSGIGLSLVYRTIQLHDGEIEVESTPGRGTTFRVLLREALVTAVADTRRSRPLGLRDVAASPAAGRPSRA
jgi:signal transduction histidine kinase